MLIAALSTGIGITQGADSYWAISGFLLFLLVAGTSLFQLYRRK